MHIHELANESESVFDAANEDGFTSVGLDYIAECDKTASNVARFNHINVRELVSALRQAQVASEQLNKFKKAMFRKQTRAEAGLPYSDEEIGRNPAGTLDDLAAGMGLEDFFHGGIGLITETGEVAELLADVLEGKRRPDIDNAREEGGDILWYLSRWFKWADTTFLTEMKRNINKLRTRHGAAGFNKERDMNRDLGSESEAIRKGIS